jgi:tricarballylate dehydrogenase
MTAASRPAPAVPLAERWDVIVIGGGNAGLVAAISAREKAERVLLLDRAPIELRGGNTRHTRNLRCVHRSADAYNTGPYKFDEFWEDLARVGTGPNDLDLARQTLERSESTPTWMTEHGIHWQPPLHGTLHLGRTNRFFLGGGKALVNTYHRTLARLGIAVAYDVRVDELVVEQRECVALRGYRHDEEVTLRAGAYVCASGGFEANLEWLGRYWGDAAQNYLIRGPRFNDGIILKQLYQHGAEKAGEEKSFHAVAIDARSPQFDGGIATRIDSIPYGVVVNRHGMRFYDEGEELWPKRYAIWGGNVARQDGQIAYVLWDSKVTGLFLPPIYPPYRADSIEDLAAQLQLDPVTVGRTVKEFNAAGRSGAAFDPTRLDGLGTAGISPPKSNWAQPLDTPPYFAIPVRPGITFTYMGVRIDPEARVRLANGGLFTNVLAAGEIMSGNILSSGYLAGFGMTIGSVWGRIAGAKAAEVAAREH